VAEYIVPKKGTPILRADATDDVIEDAEGEGESGTKYKFATGGIIEKAQVTVLVCPICGLESCGHNLALIPKDPS
jgi:hypothetical protein